MRQSSNVQVTFQRSVAVVTSAASLVLCLAEGGLFPSAVTPFVVLLSYLLVDRRKSFRLSIVAANGLGLIAFGVMAWEFYGNTLVGKLLAGAHLLVYMTWVVLWLQKGIRQYWWLLALSVLQISVASVLTREPSFGLALVGMLLLMVWTLSVFSLHRAQLRQRGSEGESWDSLAAAATDASTDRVTVRNGLQLDTEERWIGARFYGITSFAFVASLLIGCVAFAVFPRVWVDQGISGLETLRQALPRQTGFTESVELGEIGQIMQSDKRALQFEITRMRSGEAVDPFEFANAMKMDEIMFRGNVLGHYRKGRWTSGARQGTTVGDLGMRNLFNRESRESDFRITITQEPPIAGVVFAPTPALNARLSGSTSRIEKRRISHSLVPRIKEEKDRANPLTYEIWCAEAPPGQDFHSPRRMNWSDIAYSMIELAMSRDSQKSNELLTERQ